MKYYIVNAFSSGVGNGNPACVVYTDEYLEDEEMQQLAAVMNLSETAFVKKLENGYSLRWFTPSFEIDLCGHATLASAYVILDLEHEEYDEVDFYTKSGILHVDRISDSFYEMLFPKRSMIPFAPSSKVYEAIGLRGEYYASREIVVVLEDEEQVARYQPDYDRLAGIDDFIGVVITAPGKRVDFVSRYFCTGLRREDPVTGSSHCYLAPFWSHRLQKKKLIAKQMSERGGTIWCRDADDGVYLSGSLFLSLEGNF